MELKIKKLQFSTGKPVCMIHEKTARKMSLHVTDRVMIKNREHKKIISVIDIVSGFIAPDEIAVSDDILSDLNLKNREKVDIEITPHPHSISLIKKKLKGHILKKEEIKEIIENIANNALTEVEVAFFVAAVYTKGMNMKETEYLTKAMVESGNRMELKGKVVDKHSIGGIAGNRTTPLVVSICAAAGLTMPKTSSRAITSAAGTADVIETIARVDFPVQDIKKIIHKVGACMVWGGSLGLAPVDDKIIKIERIVNIDSTAQVLASILSKKISVGSKYILIDIPYGRSAKVSKEQGKKLREKFIFLGKKFGLKIDVVLTNGNEPIGNGIGPVLEMKDILKILKREDGPKDLEEKALFLSGRLLELAGKARKGRGYGLAKDILGSKKAFKKFEEIIQAQQGNVNHFKIPKFSYTIKARRAITIQHYDNKYLNNLARIAGCPEDKEAGIYLYKKKHDQVQKNENILTIYADSEEKLKLAKTFFKNNKKRILEIS